MLFRRSIALMLCALTFLSCVIISLNVQAEVARDWGTPIQISVDPGNASYPQVVMNDNGDAIVVWYQNDGSTFVIKAIPFSKGIWGTLQTISTGTGDSGQPVVAMNGNGDAIAVWRQYNGSMWVINANTYTDGAWKIAQTISTLTLN